MSKLKGISINAGLDIINIQEVEFVSNEDGLIEVKAAVGAGKTTIKQGVELALSAGNQQKLSYDTTKFKKVDVEIQLTYGSEPVFMHTYHDKGGSLKSVAYRKLADGKLDKDPVINGKKLTPAALRDILRTDLTFGIDNFLSEVPKVHMEFMMSVYSPLLKELGVIFDTKSEAYNGSILWKLEQAKMKRKSMHDARRAINGFKEALVGEGWDEQNIPEITKIETLETEKTEFVRGKEKELRDQISGLTEKAQKANMVVHSYNHNLMNEETIRKTTLDKEIKDWNKVEECVHLLERIEAPCSQVSEWLSNIPVEQLNRNLEKELAKLPPLKKVPLTPDVKVAPEAYTMSFNKDVDNALIELKTLRSKIGPLIKQQDLPIETVVLDSRIKKAKDDNEIANRWNAYFDWYESDQEVKGIWKEYCEMYSKLNLGVPGLSIQVVGDEESSSIRTMYNGEHNTDFFRNENKEHRLLTQYSTTQRPVIAILMQVYLLEEKLKKGEDGLRAMWIEAPIDNRTRDLLIDIKKKYDIEIIVGVTGDFTYEGLERGQILIENGNLICKS